MNRIQRFCLNDGPGIRSTVFLQGCSLRCWWCQNPETIAKESPLMSEVSVDDLVCKLERDARYWLTSDGGVTLSGGEPLLQARSTAKLLGTLGMRGHHRAVDTSGAVENRSVRIVAPHVDLWLWDLKTVDKEKFKKATGGSARRPLENLEWILRNTETPVTVRIPLIRGFNDTDEVKRIAAWLVQLPRPVVTEVLQGHDLSHSKSRKLSRPHSAVVTKKEVDLACATLREAGLQVVNNRKDDKL